MKELLERLNSDFDDADGWIQIVDADWFADDLRLDLSIKFNDESEAELWEIECTGVFEESLSSEGTEFLSLSSESPLLKPYIEKEIDLMFSENSLAPELLFGLVCSCCIEIMGKPNYIKKFLNLQPTVQGIATSPYGLLGRFPESIANNIVNSLKDQPIKVNIMPGREPKHWTGTDFVRFPKLKALEIGESYVIGESFSANRV
ncbi:MAG: hypothetical protein OEY43_03225 [Gammaproteobacteria bacterium]|nr:hypothetical protein [Gammaproteobacteria bacterium]